ncbi:MAG: ExeA family protein [Planctomyces sp.]
MYESYWKLKEKPFQAHRQTDQMFRSYTQQVATLRLMYSIESCMGAGMLIGPSGSGKSTLIRSVRRESSELRPFVHILYPLLNPSEMLRQIVYEMTCSGMNEAPATIRMPGIGGMDGDDAMLRQIEQVARDSSREGRQVVICFDDAHQLTDDVLLHVVHPLLNLSDSEASMRVSIILAGQPVLAGSIRRHAQISDRVAVVASIQGFSRAETAEYIETAVRAAGANSEIFSAAAIQRLFEVTAGNPRRLNRLCDMALLVGFAERRSVITPAIIDSVSRELMPAAA